MASGDDQVERMNVTMRLVGAAACFALAVAGVGCETERSDSGDSEPPVAGGPESSPDVLSPMVDSLVVSAASVNCSDAAVPLPRFLPMREPPPMVFSCSGGDTSFRVFYYSEATGEVVAAGRMYRTSVARFDRVRDSVKVDLMQRFGPGRSCFSVVADAPTIVDYHQWQLKGSTLQFLANSFSDYGARPFIIVGRQIGSAKCGEFAGPPAAR